MLLQRILKILLMKSHVLHLIVFLLRQYIGTKNENTKFSNEFILSLSFFLLSVNDLIMYPTKNAEYIILIPTLDNRPHTNSNITKLIA